MAQPTAPIELDAAHASAWLQSPTVDLSDGFIAALASICTISQDHATRAGASRDWWPLAMAWALEGKVGQLGAVVARPADAQQVAAVLQLCTEHRVPVTATAGRSGVSGASIPVFGGVIADMTAMAGIVAIDDESLTVDVLPGTFGHEFESELKAEGFTLGHWPQSIELSTVGGWLACRSAGQYSTRYGKIEDMVVGLEVALADGTIITTGGSPRAANGPDLNQVFVGSEGTLGIITRATLRLHPAPPAERRAAYSFASFRAGMAACRRVLRRGATPAVLRLYDGVESQRGHGGDGQQCILLILDEGEPALIDGVMDIVAAECVDAQPLSSDLVQAWTLHRNDVSALQPLTRKGFVVDTMEIAAPWSRLPRIYDAALDALLAVAHARTASCHLSHAYADGACLYFTFAATPPAEERDSTYVAMWEAGTRAVLANGGNLSHHHGVGLHRGRFMAEALGPAFEVVKNLKAALDPTGILNPGKLGLPSPWGQVQWPG